MVVDLNTGAIVHWVRFEGIVTELYDLQVLPGVKRPMALGFQTEEIAQLISLEPYEEIESNRFSYNENEKKLDKQENIQKSPLKPQNHKPYSE